MSYVDFPYFDCDNHFYEALDAFTRHIDPKFRKRAMQWVEVDGKKRLMVGEKINRFIPNPTFDPVSNVGLGMAASLSTSTPRVVAADDEVIAGEKPRDLSYVTGGLIMALGGIIELVFGIKAEGKSLETVTKPLTAAAT